VGGGRRNEARERRRKREGGRREEAARTKLIFFSAWGILGSEIDFDGSEKILVPPSEGAIKPTTLDTSDSLQTVKARVPKKKIMLIFFKITRTNSGEIFCIFSFQILYFQHSDLFFTLKFKNIKI
jgi:hypothetical protein